MTYSLYKCESKDVNTNLYCKYEVKVFKPTIFKPFLKGSTESWFDKLIYLYWLFISYFNLSIYYVKEGNQIIHTSLVEGNSFKFPFLTKLDWHIGPCYTNPKYRGQGIYPFVLKQILLNHASINGGTNYMIIEENNASSIKGVMKVGFKKISSVDKRKFAFLHRYELPIDGWRYYNHAVLPATAPHITPDLSSLKDGSIWCLKGHYPFFVRYTTDFDCNLDTGWYYIIKDSYYDLNKISSKKKYNINKGRKCFYVKQINPKLYAKEIANIQEDAYEGYSTYNYMPFSKQVCIDAIDKGAFDSLVVWGAFSRDTDELCGFYSVKINDKCIYLVQLKVLRNKEKQRINYALIDGVLNAFADFQKKGFYFSNGCKNLYHHTNFNELLCENFGFRKAYCRLHMVFPWYIKPFIFILYKFRHYIDSIKTKSSFFYKINAVIQMVNISRKCDKLK